METYDWIFISITALVIIPIVLLLAINLFGITSNVEPVQTYDEFIVSIKEGIDTFLDDFVIIGNLLSVLLKGIIDIVDFILGWLIGFLWGLVADGIEILRALPDFGIPQWVGYLTISIYVLIPSLILIKHLPTT